MAISATDVKTLRDRTSAPMMDCKAALTATDGDMEKAIQWLREKGKTVAAGKAEREAAEGRIGAYIDADKAIGALIEVRCESAPVAKGDHFVKLANELAKQVALKDPKDVEALLAQSLVDDPKKTVSDHITELIGVIRENMKPARFVRLTGGQMGSYIHHDGSVGVLTQVEAAKPVEVQILRDVCMHVTAKNPIAARREDVAAEVIEREREIAKNQAAATGKPANIVDKIAEGKLKTWFGENVLVEQPFVKDDTRTVGELLKGAGATLKTFARLKVGEK
jgi:elongation factor Ts